MAVLTETAPELQSKLERWVDFYQPASPGEEELVYSIVMASVQRRRAWGYQTAKLNDQIRTARLRFDQQCEDQVEAARSLFPTNPARAVFLLRRTAMGCRWLISRFTRIQTILEKEGTLYGADRSELIELSGAEAYVDVLNQSEGAYLTWLFCLVSQPEPSEEELAEMGGEGRMPASLRDRKVETWLPPKPICQEVLRQQVAIALAVLRERETHLRAHFEAPARAQAEERAQALEGQAGVLFARYSRMHDLEYHRSYNALLQGRREMARSGQIPGAPTKPNAPEGQVTTSGGDVSSPPIPEPNRGAPPASVGASVEAAAAAQKRDRERAAEVVAPGPVNGIGAAVFRGDAIREATVAAGWSVGPEPGAEREDQGAAGDVPGEKTADVDVGAG
jgi:hypothetical protein